LSNIFLDFELEKSVLYIRKGKNASILPFS
jgi:hypothetical protein